MKATSRILLLILTLHLASCGNKVPLMLPESSFQEVMSYERN
tara:strand:- start:503 stop:628 length:126 start_codon:yes stop_codon:yes gene_type:complete